MATNIRQPLVGVALTAICGICVAPIFSCWNWIFSGLGTLLLWRIFSGTGWILASTICLFGCLRNIQSVESAAALFSHSLSPGIAKARGIVVKAYPLFRGKSRLIVRIQTLRLREASYAFSMNILVPWKGEEIPTVGSTVEWSGKMQPVRDNKSPIRATQFNYQSWLSSQGVYLEFYRMWAAQVVSPPAAWRPTHWATVIRNRLEQAITRGIKTSKKEAALIRALTLGADRETEKMLADIFRRTGTYHIFSVSGLHVGMIAAIAWQTLKIFGVSQRFMPPSVISLLLIYAAITGLRPPAIRATCMAGILLCGTYVKRQACLLNSLAAAAVCMLCYDSQLLFRPGFQLSFVVVSAIICLAPPIHRLGQRFVLPDPFLPRRLLTFPQRMVAKIGKAISAILAVTIAAWLGSTPLLLWHFQNASLSALFINPLVVPLAFLMLTLAAITFLCDFFLSHWLAAVFANANFLLAWLVLKLVQWGASIPGGFLTKEE